MRYISLVFLFGCSYPTITDYENELYQTAYKVAQQSMPIPDAPTLTIVAINCNDNEVLGVKININGCLSATTYPDKIIMSDSRYDDSGIVADKPSDSNLCSNLTYYLIWRGHSFSIATPTINEQNEDIIKGKLLYDICHSSLISNGL